MLRSATLALTLLLSGTAAAQFQGLDEPQPPPKKKKAPPKTPAPTTPAPATPAATTSSGAQDLGLDLSPPAPVPAQPATPVTPAPASKKGTAPTTTFEALDVTGRTADRQRLEAANAAFNRGEYDKAALAAWELMNDPKMAPLQLESQYLLGEDALPDGPCTTPPSGEFSQDPRPRPGDQFFNESLEWLFFISHKTVNEAVILDEMARYANAEWPERFRDEFHYLLARYYFVRGRALDDVDQTAEAAKSFDEVRQLALKIPRSDPFYAAGQVPRGAHLLPRREDAPGAGVDEGGGPGHPSQSGSRTAGAGPHRGHHPRAGVHAAGAHPLRRPAEPLRHLLLRQGRAREHRSGWRRSSSPPGPTTASASTSRRWAISSPSPPRSSATSTSPRR